MKRTTKFGIVTAFLTLALISLGAELVLRLYHAELFSFESLHPDFSRTSANPRAAYDPRLGWVPTKGRFLETADQEGWFVDEVGLRSNGSSSASDPSELADAPILALGDSFTFGDEVRDHETWPAQLEALTGQPVVNAGVFAYGVDQAFLRAQSLIARIRPGVVLFAFISDDINRAEFSYYWGWKPYFELIDDELALRNVPVPTNGAPEPRYGTLHSVLGYSFLANTVLWRMAPQWWYQGPIKRVHSEGEAVTVALLRDLDKLASDHGARLFAVTLGTNGQIGSNARLPAVVEEARRVGIDVIDLAPELSDPTGSEHEDMFLTRGHYTPRTNGLVARRIAEYIDHLPIATSTP